MTQNQGPRIQGSREGASPAANGVWRQQAYKKRGKKKKKGRKKNKKEEKRSGKKRERKREGEREGEIERGGQSQRLKQRDTSVHTKRQQVLINNPAMYQSWGVEAAVHWGVL